MMKGEAMLAILQAQFIQRADGSIHAQIVPGSQYSAEVETALVGRIKMRLGSEMRVQIEKVDHIPRDPSGKFRYFRSELPEP
jgi:phenylacetate-CoA ligase